MSLIESLVGTSAPLPDYPAAVWRALACPECGEPLFRADTGWVCCVGLSHTGIIADLTVVTAVEPHVPRYDRLDRGKQLASVLRELTRLSRKRLLPRVSDAKPAKKRKVPT